MISESKPAPRPSWNLRASAAPDTVALCALIVIAPQLFGGAFPWSVTLIAGLALAALGSALWVRRSSSRPVIDTVFIMMGIAWLWTCLQVVPLPSTLAETLGLGSVQSALRLRGLAWAGSIPLTISYDPGSTQLEILTGVAILSAFLAARLGGKAHRKPIAVAAVASALLLGLEGLAHHVAHAGAVFGIYTPRFTQPQLLTPLMNNNHLGGFMSMGALIAASLAAQRRGRSRHIWALASALCAMTVAWTLSRGAIGALLFGFMLLAAWLASVRRSDRPGIAIPLSVLGATLVGTLAFAGLEPILQRFDARGLDKLAVAARGLRLLDGPTWWLGIGRGAFSSTFVSEEGSLARYTHPENILVQWITEWGLPVAGALFAVLALAMWRRFRTTRDPRVAGICIAIGAVSLQNLVDFSLEMAGIVVVVAALLGVVLPATAAPRLERARRLPVTVFLLLAIALAVLAPRVQQSDTYAIVERLTRAMESDREKEFVAALRQGLALHPAEPTFALLAGTYAGTKRHRDAPRWLLIVMEEAPGWAAPHAVAARWLFERGRFDQALLEVREAEERQAGSARKEVCEILAKFPEMKHLTRAAPGADLRVAYLDRASACPKLPPGLRAEIDAAILQIEPARPTAVLRQARRLASQERFDEASSLLQQALEHDPDDASLWVATIRAELDAGDAAGASSTLNAARSRGLDTRSLTETQARIEAGLGQIDAMRVTLTRLRGRSKGSAALMARSFLLQGQLEASLGNVDEALAAYVAADRADPQTPALEYAAQLAIRSERTTRARRFYRTLCAREPGGAACAQSVRLSKEAAETGPARSTP